jgi:hypothetical protein
MQEIVDVLDKYIHYLSRWLLSDSKEERRALRLEVLSRIVEPICNKRFDTERPESREELEAEAKEVAEELEADSPCDAAGMLILVDDGSCYTPFSTCPLSVVGICGALEVSEILHSFEEIPDVTKGVIKAYIVECVLLREKTLKEMEKTS